MAMQTNISPFALKQNTKLLYKKTNEPIKFTNNKLQTQKKGNNIIPSHGLACHLTFFYYKSIDLYIDL